MDMIIEVALFMLIRITIIHLWILLKDQINQRGSPVWCMNRVGLSITHEMVIILKFRPSAVIMLTQFGKARLQ